MDPPPSGRRDLVFEIDRGERGEPPLWSESRQVESREGNYSLLLGTVEPLTVPPGEGYTLSVRLEGPSGPIETQAVAIMIPAGRDGIIRQTGTPVYRLVMAKNGDGRKKQGAVAESAAKANPIKPSGSPADVMSMSSASSAPKLLFVGVEVEETSGNTDGMLEPGETINLKVKLYNDGNAVASSVSGTLDYLGTNPDVPIPDKTASWPNLTARGACSHGRASLPGLARQHTGLRGGAAVPARSDDWDGAALRPRILAEGRAADRLRPGRRSDHTVQRRGGDVLGRGGR